ncbi:MAG: aminoacyl-tRNA hydrolase [Gammaproteobacteria bacterium]|nr:aminoacyl-tRNA hydrolase [Gammaproteobacteria bacterium]
MVGLGNPGRDYADTRHNAGFWFVDAVARKYGGSFKAEKKFHGELARTRIDGNEVWLLKPDTFMNLSGQAVLALMQFYKIALASVLVVHDELDLPVGVARLKQGGGHGGHNGLRDITNRCGGNGFQRLRLGIGHPGDKSRVTNHVLTRVSSEDQQAIEHAMADAMDVLPLVIDGEFPKAMNKLHSD